MKQAYYWDIIGNTKHENLLPLHDGSYNNTVRSFMENSYSVGLWCLSLVVTLSTVAVEMTMAPKARMFELCP